MGNTYNTGASLSFLRAGGGVAFSCSSSGLVLVTMIQSSLDSLVLLCILGTPVENERGKVYNRLSCRDITDTS